MKILITRLFPGLRSGHRLFQRPSPQQQIPSNNCLFALVFVSALVFSAAAARADSSISITVAAYTGSPVATLDAAPYTDYRIYTGVGTSTPASANSFSELTNGMWDYAANPGVKAGGVTHHDILGPDRVTQNQVASISLTHTLTAANEIVTLWISTLNSSTDSAVTLDGTTYHYTVPYGGNDFAFWTEQITVTGGTVGSTMTITQTNNRDGGGWAAPGISGVAVSSGAVSNPYDTWAGHYAGGGTPGEDSNNDGVQNGVAYFMDARGLATNPGLVDGKVTWPHLNPVTSFEVQVSDNLQDWSAATTGVDTSDPTKVVYTLPTGAAKKFCRLVVIP